MLALQKKIRALVELNPNELEYFLLVIIIMTKERQQFCDFCELKNKYGSSSYGFYVILCNKCPIRGAEFGTVFFIAYSVVKVGTDNIRDLISRFSFEHILPF